MAETLRSRVARVITGSAHALLDKIEDAAPQAMLEQSIREVQQVADDVRAELGLAAANRHLAQQQHVRLNSEHESLGAAIAQAIAQERDDLAKPAIARQIDIEAQLPVLEASLGQLAQEEKELSGFVDALLAKRREMERAIRELEASRAATAHSAAALTKASGPASAKILAAQSAFDRTYQRQTGLSPNARHADLEQSAKLQELGDLMRNNKIDERLAALKAGA